MDDIDSVSSVSMFLDLGDLWRQGCPKRLKRASWSSIPCRTRWKSRAKTWTSLPRSDVCRHAKGPPNSNEKPMTPMKEPSLINPSLGCSGWLVRDTANATLSLVAKLTEKTTTLSTCVRTQRDSLMLDFWCCFTDERLPGGPAVSASSHHGEP